MSQAFPLLPTVPKTPDLGIRIRSTRLLVIEDDTSMIPLVSRALTYLDPDIVLDWATNADDARSALTDGQYDAILSDFMLADSDSGFSIYSDCRTLQPNARFAMMSALPISLPDGAYGLLAKPFDVNECRNFIEGLLGDMD